MLKELMKKLNISFGDIVKVKKDHRTYEGVLLESSHGHTAVIKLPNGYNVGIDLRGSDIEIAEKRKERRQERMVKQERGDVAILSCGGTIASKVEYKTGAVFPLISPEEITAAFPNISSICSFHTKRMFALFSEDLTPYHWSAIAKEVHEEVKQGIKGVVLLHGTDTMHYTSAALSFMLQNLPVPVVLVGAQRSSDRPSSDNELNLLNAVYASTKDVAHVAVCMHMNIEDGVCALHAGTRVRKMHTSRRDAFRSINTPPLALLDYRKDMFDVLWKEYNKRGKREMLFDNRVNENVALVYFYPGMKKEMLEKLDCDGIVLVGTGLGHVAINPFEDKSTKGLLPSIKNLIESNVPVVLATQTIYGRINMNVYTTGRMMKEVGVIGDGADWTPETAYAKLCWVLGHEKDMKKIEEEMLRNIAGEITERSLFV